MDADQAIQSPAAHGPKVWDPIGDVVPVPFGPRFDRRFCPRLAHVDATHMPSLRVAHRQDLPFSSSSSPLPLPAVALFTVLGRVLHKSKKSTKYSLRRKNLAHEFQ